MLITRRKLLAGSALSWLFSRILPSYAAPSAPTQLLESTLTAYVDVLVPADETPSASELDVDKQLLSAVSGQRDYQRLLEMGLDWLNKQSRAQFGRSIPELEQHEREAVVGQAAEAGYETLPRIFFERTRADTFFLYYGRPESWQGIAQYSGPPQPLGFPDYTKPPRVPR